MGHPDSGVLRPGGADREMAKASSSLPTRFLGASASLAARRRSNRTWRGARTSKAWRGPVRSRAGARRASFSAPAFAAAGKRAKRLRRSKGPGTCIAVSADRARAGVGGQQSLARHAGNKSVSLRVFRACVGSSRADRFDGSSPPRQARVRSGCVPRPRGMARGHPGSSHGACLSFGCPQLHRGGRNPSERRRGVNISEEDKECRGCCLGRMSTR
jgi:hypothetical protein